MLGYYITQQIGTGMVLHTSPIHLCSLGTKVVEQEKYEEKEPAALQVSCALTLRHPNDFGFLQDACATVSSAFGLVSCCLLVWVVHNVPRWERYGSASHKARNVESA